MIAVLPRAKAHRAAVLLRARVRATVRAATTVVACRAESKTYAPRVLEIREVASFSAFNRCVKRCAPMARA